MDIAALLGDDASLLLDHTGHCVPQGLLTLPGPNYLQDIFTQSDRTPTVLRNLGTLYNHGRLGGTGYVSILPVDQGIEHSAAANFSPNPGVLRPRAPLRPRDRRGLQRHRHHPRYARHRVASLRAPHPLHREDQSQRPSFATPTRYDQRLFASVQQAADLGAVGVGATIYFGSEGSIRQIEEISARPSPRPTDWVCSRCCGPTLRNDAFKTRRGRLPRQPPT